MSVTEPPETLQNLGFGRSYLPVNSSDTECLGCISPRACPDRAPRREKVETDPSQTVTTQAVGTIGG